MMRVIVLGRRNDFKEYPVPGNLSDAGFPLKVYSLIGSSSRYTGLAPASLHILV